MACNYRDAIDIMWRCLVDTPYKHWCAVPDAEGDRGKTQTVHKGLFHNGYFIFAPGGGVVNRYTEGRKGCNDIASVVSSVRELCCARNQLWL